MEEFLESRYLPIFNSVESRAGYPGRFFPRHFFREWRKWMELGIARTWEAPGAVLGMLFTPNVFTGDFNAQVVFWFSMPKCQYARELFKAAVEAAKKSGCRLIQSAAYTSLRGDAMKRLYRRMGFEESETIFRKVLV